MCSGCASSFGGMACGIRPRWGRRRSRLFLSHLANARRISPATHNQALSALLFLYREVLGVDMPWLDRIGRPRVRVRLPVALNPAEVQRLMEGFRLRVKDVDFGRRVIVLRDGKGGHDRLVMLPGALAAPLREQIGRARLLWQIDRESGRPGVAVTDSLARSQSRAGLAWGWFWVFPALQLSTDPQGGPMRRHHLFEQRLQRALKRAAFDAGVDKPVSAHSLRHAFATALLQDGSNIRTVQELLGHADVATTMIYTHALQVGGGVQSPLDHAGFDRATRATGSAPGC